jgi:hypothetical protein
MLDTILRPCSECHLLRARVRELNDLLADLRNFRTCPVVWSTNYPEEHVNVGVLEVCCTACKNRGQVLTEAGNLFVNSLAPFFDDRKVLIV